MSTDFLDVMATGLTPAYDRGMERLAVPLTADGTGTLRPDYDLSAYRARHGREPDAPRFLLAPTADIAEPLTVRITFTRTPGAPEESTDLRFPAGWPAGDQIAVELPGSAAEFTAALELTGLRPLPPAPAGPQDWELTALLGTLARLLWTIGRDYQDLARRGADVARQRSATGARGAGLDLIGRDLGAPRFPPHPYAPDDATLVLYHLDDRPTPDGLQAASAADAGGRHPAAVNGAAQAGQTGRFGPAFGFTAPDSNLTVPDSPDLALPADFTVEAVVRPDPAARGPGAVVAKRSPLNTPAAPGWALTLGSYQGVDHNPRFSLADGTTETELFAARNLADGQFHHLAATVRRTGTGAVAQLHLDGAELDRRSLDQLGPVLSAEPLTIGRGQESTPDGPVAAQYQGLIEEVRISTTARTTFAPVTGESDDQYRRRLSIFQRWLVPTPDNLQDAVNQVAGPVAGDHAAFVVDETTAAIATGSSLLRVLPPSLTAGQSITADGDRLRTEPQTVGTADDEPDFDPAWLCRHADRARPGLDFADDDANRLMQFTTRRALDALLDRLAGQPGILSVLRAYDPAGPGLHAVGRALNLRHSILETGMLGVHAHAAGFGWVTRTADDLVHAAQPPGDTFALTLDTAGDTDPTAGQTAHLALDPPVSGLADALVRWSVTREGPGNAIVTPDTPLGHATLQALTAGDVTVGVEVTRAGHTRGGRRTLRIGLPEDFMTIGQTIGRDGRIGVSESESAGTVTTDFDPSYLQLRTDDLALRPAHVDYGFDVNNRRMQPAAGAALDRLLARLAGRPGTLTVVSAYDPSGFSLAHQGRALVLRYDQPTVSGQPSPVTGPALAAHAFAAGFDFVTLQNAPDPGGQPIVRAAVAPGEQLAVTLDGPAAEVTVGGGVRATVSPRAAPVAACFRPDGSLCYLAERGSHRVAAYALTADSPSTLPVLAFEASVLTDRLPIALAFVGGRLFVAHERGRVLALDPGTLAATPVVTPDAVALATDGTLLYLTCTDHTLRAYDPQSGAQTTNLLLPGLPGAIAASPNSPPLAVLLDGGRFCLVVRPSGPVVGGPVTIPGVARALCAAFSSDGAKLYIGVDTGVTGPGSGAIQVYPTGATTPSATLTALPPGTGPVAMCMATDGRHLYVATSGSGQATGRVHVVDTTTDTLLPLPFAAGDNCLALAASPVTAGYPPCLLAAPEGDGTLLLADQTPLGQSPPQPPRLFARQPLGPDNGVDLAWSALPLGPGGAEPADFEAPATRVDAAAPGLVRLRADYLRGSPVLPYQCEVRLKDALDARPEVVIGKDQYDLVLNVLKWFQPIGVEFRTGRLRAHVRELARTPGEPDVLPAFTFPTYRTYDQAPFRRPEEGNPS
ncbi:LamG-like jellyroll fold domain-containing protein [Streptomyces sp. NPDC020192]|uniref:LamG-like jellyroll fold domain-containing protein n=1 Tax=Streptomyces sp. NPDC020192 TaxID=3365066 RepID=UPI00378E423F